MFLIVNINEPPMNMPNHVIDKKNRLQKINFCNVN
jgi:hypothetical protein